MSLRRKRIRSPRLATMRFEPLESRQLLTAAPGGSDLTSDDWQFADDQVFSGDLVERIDYDNALYEIGGHEVRMIATPPLANFIPGPLPADVEALGLHVLRPAADAGDADGSGIALAGEAADFTPTGIPILHSFPTAPAIVYLDFDGNFEPSWGGNTNVVTPPYDLDGDGQTFDRQEQNRIEEIWARVSEDFAPFNIDVTTEDPSDATTVLRQVVDAPASRIRTFYFRHDFFVADPTQVSNLVVDLLRDDGAAVYLNGTQIVRDNLPAGATYDDFALQSTSGDDEDTFFSFNVDSNLLEVGQNVIAVEVHQQSDTSSDVSFDLSLRGDVAGAARNVVSRGAEWRYLQDGSDLGTVWRAPNFDDASWEIGNAQFGYGESDENTTLNVFDGEQPRVRTYYFRDEFDVADASAITNLAVRVLRDDGAAVYLNGVEIRRDNLEVDAAYDDFATTSVNGNDESTYFSSLVDSSLLVDGLNVLAVEVHQHSDTSSDVSFDLQLEAQAAGGNLDLVSKGNTWRYLDDGSDQGTAWRSPGFDDALWNVGTAQFGYGDVTTGTVHVAIGREDWYDGNAGGVAFVNSFSQTGRAVVFAFTNGAGSGAKNMAEVASHEAGHAFGLAHQSSFDADGNETHEYNPGIGDWAPIMGVGYDPNLTTWHNGPTSSPTNLQDDLARIARDRNGFGYRTDDHGNSRSNATSLLSNDTSINVSGIIERNSDRDVFAFGLSDQQAGVSVELAGAEVGTNLDAVLEIRDENDQLVAIHNPQNSYGASIETDLPPGDYTLVVRNNGEYGRLGRYTIIGEVDEPRRAVDDFQRVGPLGSLMLASRNQTARINFDGDVDEYIVHAQPGDYISVVATPVDAAATLSLEVVGVGLTATATRSGESVTLQTSNATTERDFVIRVGGDVAGTYKIDFGKNLVFESIGTSDLVTLPIDSSELEPYAGRLGVLGHSSDGSDGNRVLVPTGAVWKYLDDGSNQGTAWRQPVFDDASWPTGAAELGYGDGDEATVIDEDNAVGGRIRTFYFRLAFEIDDPNTIGNLMADLKYDDGAVVYLNGTEIIRDNLPANPAFNVLATGEPDDEDEFVAFEVNSSAIVAGTNVLAVEVHQRSDTSSDVTFDLGLRTLAALPEPISVIPAGAAWRYLDDGSNQGTVWRGTNFNDDDWTTGRAEFGYGDDDEVTELDENGTSNARTRTFYFRKALEISDPASISEGIVRLKYDDGVAVYLNGNEIIRDNLPANAGFRDFAPDKSPGENQFFEFAFDPAVLFAGANVIAVEVHQESDTSSDVSFDLQLLTRPRIAEVDSYSFVVTQLHEFDVLLNGDGVDFSRETLELITPGGTTIGAVPSGDVDLAILDFAPAETGVYRLRVESFTQGDYGLVVAGPTALDSEQDLTADLAPGYPGLGYISAGDEDEFTVDLIAGESIAIYTRTPWAGATDIVVPNTLNPRVELVLDGVLDSVVARDADSLDGKNSIVVLTPTSSGPYRVRVVPESGLGEYVIGLTIPGDADLNGTVDAFDFEIWNANRFTTGTHWLTADFNRSGFTDVSDFNIWNDHKFHSRVVPPGPVAAPRPALSRRAIVSRALHMDVPDFAEKQNSENPVGQNAVSIPGAIPVLRQPPAPQRLIPSTTCLRRVDVVARRQAVDDSMSLTDEFFARLT